ncbi:MAG TPA: TonB-dependent receptor plug domain-containing protein [Gemmatimonadaceae bacterium]
MLRSRFLAPVVLVVAAITLSPAALLAQVSTVRGTVIDRQTGSPIAGAAVVVSGTTIGTLSNDAGVFSLSSTTTISRLTVSSVGYLAVDVPVTSGQPLVIRLTPSRTELPGMHVVAARNTPSTSTLTQSDLQRAGGVALQNAINTVPGVFMQTRTPFGGARITLRGYYPSTSGNSPNANGLGYQVFLNDIPVTDATGATVLDDIDYARLGRAEIIKGPASSQYGSAIGGTLLLTSIRPVPDRTSLLQQVQSGSYGLLRTTTSFETATSSSDAVIDYGHQEYDSFRPHSGSQKEFVHATGDVSLGDRQTLSAYFSYNRSFEELAGEIDSVPYYDRQALSNAAYLANDSHIALTSFMAGVTNSYRFGEHFTNRTTIFSTGRSANQPFAHGFTDVTQVNGGARSVFGYSTQWGRTAVTGSLGGALQRSNITTNGVFIIPAPPYPERPTAQENWASNGSLFSEWSFGLPSQVTATVGASLNANRFAIHNLLRNGQLYDTTTTQVQTFDAVLTPRAMLSKAFGSAASMYASVSTGYTPPLLSNVVTNTGEVVTGLKPERAVQYEIGAQGALLDDRLHLQASLFDIENTDKLLTQTANSVTSTVNAGKQRNGGAEVTLAARLLDDPTQVISSVRPWVSWTWTEATFVDFRSDNNANASTVDYSGNAVPRVPRNMINVGLDVGARSGAYLTSTWQHVTRVPVTFDNSTWVRGYDLLGAKLGVQRQVAPRWIIDVFAGGDNLLGRANYSFLFVGPNYGGLATPAYGGHGDGYIIPAPYRATLYGNVTLRYVIR